MRFRKDRPSLLKVCKVNTIVINKKWIISVTLSQFLPTSPTHTFAENQWKRKKRANAQNCQDYLCLIHRN